MLHKHFKMKLLDFPIDELIDASEFFFYEKLKKLNYSEISELFFKLFNDDNVHNIVFGENDLRHEATYVSDISAEANRLEFFYGPQKDHRHYERISYKFHTISEIFRLGNTNDISKGWSEFGENINTVQDLLDVMS